MSRPRSTDKSAPYQPVSMAAEISGLSKKYIYEGCKNGTIAHVKVGIDYRIFMPALLLRPATRLTSKATAERWDALQAAIQHTLMFYRTRRDEAQRKYDNLFDGAPLIGAYNKGLAEAYESIIEHLERWTEA